MKTTSDTQETAVRPGAMFSSIVVGIDGSPESREAARQASLLLEDEGELTLLAAYDIAPALGGTGLGVPAYLDADAQRKMAEDALQGALEETGGPCSPATKVVRGSAWKELIREAEREQDSLIAVGSHGIGRAQGIVVGSTTTELVHKASRSVLVARKAGPEFPRRIVVGVDGSPQSLLGVGVAAELVERLGASVRALAATGGKPIDIDGLVKIKGLESVVFESFGRSDRAVPIRIPMLEWSERSPVEALLAASAEADLLIVGSRGLHGFNSLGSVSERIAHRARSSVLIVRSDGRPDAPALARGL